MGAYYAQGGANRTQAQLKRYEEHYAFGHITYISSNIIPGCTIPVNDDVAVKYWTLVDFTGKGTGVILYRLIERERVPETEPVPALVPVPKPERAKCTVPASFEPLAAANTVSSAATALAGALLIGAIAGGLGGRGTKALYDCYKV